MLFDERRVRGLLFGGSFVDANGSTILNDTWEWNGGERTWMLRDTGPSPEGEQMPAMAYDATRDRVLFFGSSGATWEWWGDPSRP
jgi:hypothetical protein